MESQIECIVRIASSDDHKYARGITDEMAYSAVKRGTGIPARTPEYTMKKMDEGLAVIAVNPQNDEWVGFCCLEVWDHEKYVANSGLIISPEYRGLGISREIKMRLFELSRNKFPHAKIFSLSASPAVIHVNKELGYKVIPCAALMKDKWFVKGCHSWVNFTEMMHHGHAGLNYIAMVFDPATEAAEPVFSNIGQYFRNKIKSSGKKKETEVPLKKLGIPYG